MPKRRVSLRLAENEVAIVAPKETWEHLIEIYEAFAYDPNYAASSEEWQGAANWVREWIEKAEPRKVVEDEDW